MAIIAPLPYNIQNGDPIDATPVMANFNQMLANVNANAAGLSVQNTFSQPQNGVAAILPAQFTILSQVQALVRAAVPVGTILDYASAGVPSGALQCDGSAVSRTTYALLFAAIGTTWGAGDGSTTFNVPDFRRRMSIGSGGTGTGIVGNTTGSIGGAETHGISGAELPTHNHGINDPTHSHAVSDPGHSHYVNDPGHAHAVSDPGHSHSYTGPGGGTVAGGVTFFGGSTAAANTSGSGTGIGIYGATTGIYLSASGTGMGVYGAGTGISTQNAGSSTPMSLYAPVGVVTKIIITGL
jgi:microcystin-dependent protein